MAKTGNKKIVHSAISSFVNVFYVLPAPQTVIPQNGEEAKAPAISKLPPSDQILKLLKSFETKSKEAFFYLSPDISKRKINNGLKSCNVPAGEIIIGLIDCTRFGSAIDSLLFGSQGIYYHNGAGSQPGPDKIPYKEFPQRLFERSSKYEVSLDKGQYFHTDDAGFSDSPTEISDILNGIKDLIIKWQS